MTAEPSLMARETAEVPEVVARLLEREAKTFAALGARCRALQPPVVATCARGSSDNAAGYFKYLLEIAGGVPVASIGPSIASVYGAKLRLRGGLLVSISQSGQSPDLIALQAAAREAGALTIALVNMTESGLARAADMVLPLHAGAENSVAATKSFIAAAVAAAALVAAWCEDETLGLALRSLPATLAAALAGDWSAAAATFRDAGSLYVLGRGPALPIAQEAALKCKETAAIHAEAFSTAEVMHGPLRLVEGRFPVLAFVPGDAALASARDALARIVACGSALYTAGPVDGLPGRHLATAATGHGLVDPIAMILGFYRFIEAVARARGHDPDHPPRLKKVTETL